MRLQLIQTQRLDVIFFQNTTDAKLSTNYTE